MGLKSDLEAEIKTIFADQWDPRDGQVVPKTEDVGLGNQAHKLEATVLYADISDSTKLVDGYKPHFSAEVYKAFLRCAAKIIRAENGTITAFDGDRIMAVFIGDSKNSTAAKTGLKINWAVKNIINPAIKNQYPNTPYTLKHTVGIDTSDLYIVRGGIRGSNDLLWLGRAGNYAAKLNVLSDDYPTSITKAVYDKLSQESKYSSGKDMWTPFTWSTLNNHPIYRSTYWWSLG